MVIVLGSQTIENLEMSPTVAAAWRLEVLQKFWRCACRCGHGSWKYTCRVYLSCLKLYLSLWPPDSWTCVSQVGCLVRSWKHTYRCGHGFCKFTYCRLGALPTQDGHDRTMAADQAPRTFPNTRRPPRQALRQDLNDDHNRHTSRNRATRRYTQLQEP